MRPKGDKGIGQQPPNHKWAHLRLSLAKSRKNLKFAQGPKTPKLAQGLKTQAMASGNNQRPPATFNQGVPPQDQETPGPSLREPGVVQAWSYIPL
ncbi:hypothetical protein O181_092420 [Austropuccinia psidii MF-1]|uniref:Uncharacterized protein n=1 Tax=Austropuccinia psidii MF-1 TaxID=1389203 RepID=A0A9Q3IYJ2_9BASI|nr:hypothetical protein [Austropuccinia psidii MF-1]